MASAILRGLYFQARKARSCIVGESAIQAMRTARILRKWDALESLGMVRIELRNEDEPDFSYLDTWEHLSERSKAGIILRCESLGVVIVVGQYLEPGSARFYLDCDTFFRSDLKWESADSVGDCQGYQDASDWRENPYVIDIMAETIKAFSVAWKAYVAERSERIRGICPACHGTGKVGA